MFLFIADNKLCNKLSTNYPSDTDLPPGSFLSNWCCSLEQQGSTVVQHTFLWIKYNQSVDIGPHLNHTVVSTLSLTTTLQYMYRGCMWCAFSGSNTAALWTYQIDIGRWMPCLVQYTNQTQISKDLLLFGPGQFLWSDLRIQLAGSSSVPKNFGASSSAQTQSEQK